MTSLALACQALSAVREREAMNLSELESSPRPHGSAAANQNPTASSGALAHALLGPLMHDCRAYLLEIANQEVPADLRQRVTPSDLVQETFAEALQTYDQFRGASQGELFGWLRKILLHNIIDARRYYLETQKRQPAKNWSLYSSSAGEPAAARVVDPIASPSSICRRRDDCAQLRAAIDRLPEDYRLVIQLRHFDGLPLVAVGREMGRSPDAARKLWFRAVEKLAGLMDHETGTSGN